MARSNTEIVSDLPRFKVTPSKDFKGWVLVVCPREDCPSAGTAFLVKRHLWSGSRLEAINGTVLKVRPCPYCFKTAKMR